MQFKVMTGYEKQQLKQLSRLLSLGFDGETLVRPSKEMIKAHFATASLPFLWETIVLFISCEEYEMCIDVNELILARTVQVESADRSIRSNYDIQPAPNCAKATSLNQGHYSQPVQPPLNSLM
jgi:hypothetical protein